MKRARRSQKRYEETQNLTKRVHLLESALFDVWLWQSQDGADLDHLHRILKTADSEAMIHLALDRLVKATP